MRRRLMARSVALGGVGMAIMGAAGVACYKGDPGYGLPGYPDGPDGIVETYAIDSGTTKARVIPSGSGKLDASSGSTDGGR